MKKFLRFNSFFVFIYLILSSVGIAQSASNNLGEAGEYNVYIIYTGEFLSSDTEGRIGVGNNALFNRYDIGFNYPNPPQDLDVLVVGGNLTFQGFSNIRNGNAVYRDTLYSDLDSVSIPEGEFIHDESLNFSSTSLAAANSSRQWKLIPANSTVDIQSSTINLNGFDPTLNVFEVDGFELSNATSINIDAPTGATVLLNISGDTLSFSGGMRVTTTSRSKVLLNYYEADTLHISGIEVLGSILAPFANVEFTSGVIYGNAIFYSYKGAGQFNHSPFTGTIEYESSEISSDCEVTIKKVLSGTQFKAKPSWFGHTNIWAGTFLGYVNGHSTEFYCVDIQHWLEFNKPYALDQVISGQIKYIVDNYYPNVPYTNSNGQLNRNYKEAAAIQSAIWHFSDGVDLSAIQTKDIRERAIEIAEEARDKNPTPVKTFEIVPASQVVFNNASASFRVTMKKADGSPAANSRVLVSTTDGQLSIEDGITDANGELSVTLTPANGSESAKVTFTTYDGIIPAGSRYYRKNAQTIVTNRPVVTCFTSTAKVVWTDNPTPGNRLRFDNFNVTNSEISDNWLTDVYVMDNLAYVATHNSGMAIYHIDSETWEIMNTANQNFNFDAATSIHGVEFNSFKYDGIVGSNGQGFVYYDSSEDNAEHYTASNSDFNGNTVNDIETHEFDGKFYAVLAHDIGYSIMDLDARTFTNFNLASTEFPGGQATRVLSDDDGELWVGTNYGLARTSDNGNTWTYYTAENSELVGNNITALAYGDGKVFVGTSHDGLAQFDKSNSTWTDLTLNISSQPVTALLYADDKLFIGNYDHGLYIYDGENFVQYSSVAPNNAPSIVNSLNFDGTELWIATQNGLSRTMNGIAPSTGEAKILLSDVETYKGGIATVAVSIEPTSEISYNTLTGTIVFNNNELEFTGFNPGPLMNGRRIKLLDESDHHYTFKIFGGNEPITEAGDLFYVSWKVKDSNPDAGISALYATSFFAGVGNELDHTDLAIISFSLEGSGNAGIGDANLDGNVDLSDLLSVGYHLDYGGEYELSGDGLSNADVNEDKAVNADDMAAYMFYLQNGLFPKVENPGNNRGKITTGRTRVDPSEFALGLRVEGLEKAAQEIRSVKVTLTYDSSLLNFDSFESDKIADGNYVNATESAEGVVQFTFASPIDRDNGFDMADIVLNFPQESIPEGAKISSTYSINGGEFQTGPVFSITATDVTEIEVLPTEYSLSQNYPNPFNPETTIKFTLPQKQNVSLKIYDVLGREIKSLIQGEFNAGVHTSRWNGTDNFGAKVATGIYFYRLEAGTFTQTNKMILLK